LPLASRRGQAMRVSIVMDPWANVEATRIILLDELN